MAELPSGTVTFLFTDLEGSTRLWEEHPEAMRVALARHDAILEEAIESCGGFVYSKMGDGMAAVFASAGDVVRATVRVQLELASEVWPEDVGALRARMGIHTGEGVLVDGHYLNQPLNRCARLMAVGHGGQVLVSGATEPLIRGDLPEGVGLVDLGEHRLRDLSRPLRVFEVRHPDLPAMFPPLRSLNAFPGNLPLQMSSFIGRKLELTRVGDALSEGRVVSLTGVGGVGKTRLALQVAAEVLPRFREGAWLVELAPIRDPDGVVDAFAGTFAVTAAAGRTLEESLVEFLRTKQLLLVVDNCEHLLEAVADLLEALGRSCPGLVVLATSREGLALDGERTFAVPPLTAPVTDADLDAMAQSDAVALFVDRAQRVDADFTLTAENASALAQVCRRLDGVPLAIELAAAQISAMNPAELARGLDRRFETLAGGRRRAVQRHQTLRAAIDWSYELCSQPEQRLLARLSVFAGGCTRESAEATCADEVVDRRALFALLRALVAKSLVIAERDGPETRYRLLETIREYGEERLAEHDETDALRNRHGECYAEFARKLSGELTGPRQIEAGKRLGTEHENLVAAMNHAIDTDNVDLALRLLLHTPSAFQIGYVLRLPVDPLFELTGAAEHPLYPYGLATAAYRAAEQGDVDTTERCCAAALVAMERLGRDPDHPVDLTVSVARGIVARTIGAYGDAAAHFERAAEIARSAGQLGVAAALLGSASDAGTTAGDVDAAVALATEGLALARRAGLPTAVAVNLTALAGALAHQDPERAKVLLRESRELRATLDYEAWVELARAVVVSARLGDWAHVLELAPASIRHLHWVGNRVPLATIVDLVARALAPTTAEAAAVLQGAAQRMAAAAHSAIDGSGPPRASAPVADRPDAPPTSSAGFQAELHRATTALLFDTLGEARYKSLRAQGEAMEYDQAVAYSLDAIERVSVPASS
jgi:predicted ATPase/class 3 adenylate cyclase